MKHSFASIFAVTLLASSTALAEEAAAPEPAKEAGKEHAAEAKKEAGHEHGGEKEFGDKGTLAIGARTSVDFRFSSISRPGGAAGTSEVELSISPEAHYFVIDSLSVGGFIQFAWTKPSDSDGFTTFGIAPVVGYNLWFTKGSLGLWPQLGFVFSNTSYTVASATTSTSVTSQKGTIDLYVPLLIHPASHFHFGIGPYLDIDVLSKVSSGNTSADGDKAVTFGIRGDIGGWLAL